MTRPIAGPDPGLFGRLTPSDSGRDPGQVIRTYLFQADAAHTRRVLAEVARLIAAAMGPDLAARTELVLAELINNVTEHGAVPIPDHPVAPIDPGRNGKTVIQLRIALHSDGPVCTLSDTGLAIPPACIEDRQCPIPANLPENGFGWPLVHKLTDRLHYVRDRGRNILSFRVPA